MPGGLLALLDDGGLHLGGLRRGDGLFFRRGLCERGEGGSLATALDKRDGDRLDPDCLLLENGDGLLREADLLPGDEGDRLGGRLNGLSLLSLVDGLR